MDTDGYFEDLAEGTAVDCGSVELTRAEMIEFAERYDPQPVHVDPDAAAESMYDGLIASGWLTCALTMRLLVTGFLNDTRIIAARGVDDLRWHLPVYAGEELTVSVEIVDKHPGEDPAFGHAKAAVTATNGDGQELLTMTGLVIVQKRDGE
jgi:acyl dehydratase